MQEVFWLFEKGGLVMWLLLAASILVVAIFGERYLYYREMDTPIDRLMKDVETKLNQGDVMGARNLCVQCKGIGAAMLERVISGGDNGYQEAVLEGMAALAAARLKEHLNHLDTIVTLAPLLGLLGTVIGMIHSFNVLNIKSGQPLAITGGVGEALVATASGLCVATLALIVHSYFVHRLDKIVTGMEQVVFFATERWSRGRRHETA